jgi:UDP:flavonoid glycosyltransferase YjiC (YdhE family)
LPRVVLVSKVYFGHGGVNGLQEAIHNRKPIVGMPLWADGEDNVNRLANRGAAIKVDKNSNADQGRRQIFFFLLNPKNIEFVNFLPGATRSYLV